MQRPPSKVGPSSSRSEILLDLADMGAQLQDQDTAASHVSNLVHAVWITAICAAVALGKICEAAVHSVQQVPARLHAAKDELVRGAYASAGAAAGEKPTLPRC